jgi:hypothetical protein
VCRASAILLIVTLVSAALAAPAPEKKKEAQAPARRPEFEPSRVSMHLVDQPLSRVLQELADLSGNRCLAAADDVKDKPVTLKADDVPYWQALDRMCRAAGLVYTPAWPTGRLKVQKQEKGKDLGGYAGPAVVKLERAAWSHPLRVVRSRAGQDAPAGDLLTYAFVAWWEDHIPVLSSSVRVTKAVTPEGKEFTPRAEPDPGCDFVVPPFGGGVVATFADVPAGTRAFARVEGVVQLDVGADQTEARINEVLTAGRGSVAVDDVTATVTGVTQRYGTATVTLKMESVPPGKSLPGWPQSEQYGFFLASPDGKRRKGFPIPMQPAAAADAATPTYSLKFVGVAEADENWTLLYVKPRWHETREYPFKVENVPVP